MMSLKQKRYETLKKEIESARDAGDWKRAEDLSEELESISPDLIANLTLSLSGCCLYVVAGLGHSVMEILVVIAALTTRVGNPLFGYVALAVIVAVFAYGFFIAPKIAAKEKAEAEALGNIYAPKSNWFIKGLAFAPDLYALYVFLVLIGAIPSQLP